MLTEVDNFSQNTELFQEREHQQVCHLDYLHRMAGGNKEFTHMMIGLYLKQLPAELEKLNAAITASAHHDMAEIAHKLKSSVTMMGATSMESILKQLEALAKKEANADEVLPLFNQLTELNSKATAELTPLLAL